jgi:mRNA-degrading endonuclease RelE of RelBE toxin-antitoxin system
MSWKIEIKPTASKYYLRLDKRARNRIKSALIDLELQENPFLHPNPFHSRHRRQNPVCVRNSPARGYLLAAYRFVHPNAAR